MIADLKVVEMPVLIRLCVGFENQDRRHGTVRVRRCRVMGESDGVGQCENVQQAG